LNGDSRETGKLTPDGKPDPSVFSTPYNREGIKLGTAVCLMVRKPKREKKSRVSFRQFWGINKRAELLESTTNQSVPHQYNQADPQRSNRLSFRISDV